ncbi:MAG: ABC transporter permease [Promethearchaeota archaeon]
MNFKYKNKKYKNKGHVWPLLVKNLKSMYRDKAQLTWLIGYPLLLIIVFALAFNQTYSRSKYDLIVINHDPEEGGTAYSRKMIQILKEEVTDYIQIIGEVNEYSLEEAEKLLKFENIDAIIIIPSNFSELINRRKEPQVFIRTIPDEVTEGVVTSIVKQIIDHLIIIRNGGTPSKIITTRLENTIQLTAFDYLAPGFVIAGVLVCISQISLFFAEEKEKQTLKRLCTTPVARSEILLSGMLSQLFVALIQTILLLFFLYLVGAYFVEGVNIFLLILIPMIFAFTCLGLGLCLASLTKSTASAGGLAWFIILPLQFLGGLFFYFENPISHSMPTYYAARAMRQVMINGATTWNAIGLDITIILSIGVISTLIGIILFRHDTAIL